MPVFSCISKFLSRYCTIICPIIFLTAISGTVYAQTKVSFTGQQQQTPQNQQDKALTIARLFDPNTRLNIRRQSPAQSPARTVTAAYPPVGESKDYRLPDQNPLLPNDVPEEQRMKGVWSSDSHQNLQARNQIPPTPEPTPRQPAVSQPQYSQARYKDDWTPITQPIRQASGDASETEATQAAQSSVQSPPPLAAPNEPRANSLPAPPMMNHEEDIFVNVQETSDFGLQASDQASGFGLQSSGNETSPFELQDEMPNISPEARSLEPEANPEARSLKPAASAKYSDRPMPKFYAQGEQKGEAAEKRKDGGFGFLPGSTGPTMTVISSLAIVLGVFFVLVWLMKRASPRQGGLLPTEVFEKLGSVPLSPKMHLHLFRLGGKLVLVSLTPDGMEPVAEVTDPDEVIHLIGLCKQNDPNSASAAFRQVLKQYTGEKGQQFQQQMSGYQQQMQQYPAQQYQQQQQYAPQQQTVRRPVGVVRR